MVKALINEEALAKWIAEEDSLSIGLLWAIEQFELERPVEILERKMNGRKRVCIRQECSYTPVPASVEALIPLHCLILIGDENAGTFFD